MLFQVYLVYMPLSNARIDHTKITFSLILCICRDWKMLYCAFFVQSKISMLCFFTCYDFVLFGHYVTMLYVLQRFECFAIIIFCFLSTRFSSRLFLPNRIGLISLGTMVSVSCYITFSPSTRRGDRWQCWYICTVHRKSCITSIFHYLGKKKRRQFWQIHFT